MIEWGFFMIENGFSFPLHLYSFVFAFGKRTINKMFVSATLMPSPFWGR